jgi:hypothetical protein
MNRAGDINKKPQSAIKIQTDVLCTFAKEGRFTLLDYYSKQGWPMYNAVLYAAIEGGSLETLEWLLTKGSCKWDSRAAAIAVEENDATILAWLKSNGYSLEDRVDLTSSAEGVYMLVEYPSEDTSVNLTSSAEAVYMLE